MGGGGEPEKEEDDSSTFTFSLSLTGVRRRSLCDAPIRFLVLSHKAFAKELAELHRLVVEEAAEAVSHVRELIVELSRRFEFLKLVYKYHCAAEDEVIFLALDAQVKNVVSTYSLEHKNIDDNFSSIFHCLHHLTKENGDNAQKFQELVCCVGSIRSTICQHMLKEEKQIFPLLEQKFSSEEQARLVWQYICSVPIRILQDFLQWMTSLSADDKEEVLDCIKFVVPKEKLLQEVVISWIDNEKQSSSRVCNLYEKGAQFFKGLASFKDVLICSPKVHSGEEQLREAYSIHNSGRQNPVDGIHLWHFAIRKDLNNVLAELYQLRSSNNSSSTLSSGIIVRLKFFLDILIFYRNALDNVFYPVINELPTSGLSLPYVFVDDNQIEGLQRLLYYKVQVGMQSSNFMEMLCGELELFIRRVSRSLTFLEKEVFPLISANCTFEVQLWLLYSSLQMMPLGLLKHMVIWFSAHLSDEESKIILNSINLNHCIASKSFVSLLHEWVRAGYSGKISIEKFRKDLQDMFKSRSYFLSEDAREGIGSSDENSGMQSNHYNTEIMEPNSALLATNSILAPSSSNITEKYDISYSSGMNLLVFFPQMMQKTSSLQYSNSSTFADLESRPMDHVLLFHKALIKDLEFLVLLSAKLFEDVGLLADFKRCFHLLQFLYQIHSDSEDEIAFPALESKGKLQNVSHSYTIDHKLEGEQFRKILHILNEISSLQGDLDTIGQRKRLYHHLCLKLHDTCISMHKILSNHIHREEIELWPLFRLHFSVKEQEKIVGHMLGRLRAEMLQEMIPWLMESITPEEQHALFSLWLKATKNTKFSEWLGEWWEGMRRYGTAKEDGRSNLSASLAADPLEVVSMYLFKGANSEGNWHKNSHKENSESHVEQSGSVHSADQAHACSGGQSDDHFQELTKYSSAVDKKKRTRILHGKELAEESTQNVKLCQTLMPPEHPFLVNQEELETAVRRVSRDSTLDPKKKAFIIQNLLMSRWIVMQKKSHLEIAGANDQENIPGKCPSYRDPLRSDFGCKHYKRNCKLLAPCCNMLHTCIRCHDEMMTDHTVDRKAITKMMCMKCLVIQPLGPTCSTPTCDNFTMAKYFCKICKLYDDERRIYHCPYCNLCRVGKGLGIDYFHCMNCNACMARSLTEHICREKCFEDNCPICHEYIFTSSSPVKALPCGHLMHSACFQDYTCIHYTCPICSKSLGDMQVYFQMLDALLAEEKIPEEYSEQTQVILCNDCEKRGTASFHWHYHKCPYCGSYNTRLL